MKANSIAVVLAPALILAAEAAYAYVGPGAGLSLLGALWALLAAVALALFFVAAWPVRKMLRARRARQNGPERGGVDHRTLSNDAAGD